MRWRSLSALTGIVAVACVVPSAACGTILGVNGLTEVQCIEPCTDGGTGLDADAADTTEPVRDAPATDTSTLDTGNGSPGADVVADQMAADEAGDANEAGDGSDGAPPCLQDLSNIGQADFQISFTVKDTQHGLYVALMNQRSTCGGGNYWDIRINNGSLKFESQDNFVHPFISLNSTVVNINDGTAHAVLVTRTSGDLAMVVDGNDVGTATGMASAFGQLPELVVGTDPCEGDGGCPNACADGTLVLTGSVTDICFTSP